MTQENPIDNQLEDNLASQSSMEWQELNEAETVEEISVRPLIFYVSCVLMLMVVLISGIAFYVFYPFQQKLSGDWQNDELGMILSSKQNHWELEIDNYQNVLGFSLVYQGQWLGSGSNIFDGKEVKVHAVLDKQYVALDQLKQLKQKSELYKEVADTSKELRLEYTEVGLLQLFQTNNVDSYFHFALEPMSVVKNEKELYLNSPYFSDTRLLFTKTKAKNR